MAEIKTTFEIHHSFNTYEDIVDIYEKITQCFESIFSDIKNLKINFRFSFDADQIGCRGDSIDEFKELAYGLNIIPDELYFSANDEKNSSYNPLANVFICKKCLKDKTIIILSSPERKYLSSLEAAIKKVLSTNKVESDIETQEEKLKKVEKEPWYAKVFWKIVIPILVTAIGGIIVAIIF